MHLYNKWLSVLFTNDYPTSRSKRVKRIRKPIIINKKSDKD